jgi:23S rRNA (cytosine1962-C5)-methyltransferase
MKSIKLTIKKGREFQLLRGHPWVYGDAVVEKTNGLKTGDQVEVFSQSDKFLGKGYLDLNSKILIRMIPCTQKSSLFQSVKSLITSAVQLRKTCFTDGQTTAYRVINGEGDGIPGLIVDKYENALSIQTYSAGLEPLFKTILESLLAELPDTKWVWRRNQIRLANTNQDGLIYGKNIPEKIIFLENGIKFSTDLQNGQKTGFFLDQRDNRDLIRQIAQDRSFLNICGYTGAFTVAAAYGGARSSVTVDIAQPALNEASNNLELNGLSAESHKLVCEDMYKYLEVCKKKFSLVVLDPPSMAKNKKDLDKALKAYLKLNVAGIKTVAHHGFLFTASCSSQVSREDFYQMVADAAFKARRKATVVKESFHALDHPISLAQIEGRYLKGLLLKLE